RAVILQPRWQVHARAIQQREEGRPNGRRIVRRTDQGLVVTQVIERAVVTAELVTMEVRRGGYQPYRPEVFFNVEGGQVEVVRLLARGRVGADKMIATGVRVLRPVDGDVAAGPVLEKDARGDLEGVARLP